MKKFDLIVIIITILLLMAYLFLLSYIIFHNDTDNVSSNITENNVSETIKENIDDENETEIIEQKAEKTTNTDYSVKEDSTPTTSTNKENNSTKQENKKSSGENKNSTTPVEENNVDIKDSDDKQNENLSSTKEEVKDVPIDTELENLKKQVEFSSYDECMKVGFDTALKDTINILGFSCPYIVYQGQILGYRLQLDYTNPMEN